jgi:hypothetical protein
MEAMRHNEPLLRIALSDALNKVNEIVGS